MVAQRMCPDVYRRHLNDERRQYNSERRRITHQQQRNSLYLLVAREWDSQRTARHHSSEKYTTKVSLHKQVGITPRAIRTM